MVIGTTLFIFLTGRMEYKHNNIQCNYLQTLIIIPLHFATTLNVNICSSIYLKLFSAPGLSDVTFPLTKEKFNLVGCVYVTYDTNAELGEYQITLFKARCRK